MALAGLRGCLRTTCVGVAVPSSVVLLLASLWRSKVNAETARPEKSSPAKPCTTTTRLNGIQASVPYSTGKLFCAPLAAASGAAVPCHRRSGILSDTALGLFLGCGQSVPAGA